VFEWSHSRATRALLWLCGYVEKKRRESLRYLTHCFLRWHHKLDGGLKSEFESFLQWHGKTSEEFKSGSGFPGSWVTEAK